MFKKILAWFRPADRTDPIIFCQERAAVREALAPRHPAADAAALDAMILEQLPWALDALIYDDRFTPEQLGRISALISSYPDHPARLEQLLDKARLKFRITEELEAHRAPSRGYEDELSFTLDDDENPIWQWHDVTILASHKPMVLGVDVLTDCGCVTKVSDQLLTKKKSEDFITPEALNFARIEGNDILVTDRHLYIKSDRAYDKVPHDLLITKHIDSKGFVISTLALRGRVLIFRINDPNFMNLVMNQY